MQHLGGIFGIHNKNATTVLPKKKKNPNSRVQVTCEETKTRIGLKRAASVRPESRIGNAPLCAVTTLNSIRNI